MQSMAAVFLRWTVKS